MQKQSTFYTIGWAVFFSALLTAVPRMTVAFLMADNIVISSAIQASLFSVTGIASAIVLTGGTAFIGHTLGQNMSKINDLRWKMLAGMWIVSLAASITLMSPALLVELRRSALAEVMGTRWQWAWAITAVFAIEILATSAMVAMALMDHTQEHADAHEHTQEHDTQEPAPVPPTQEPLKPIVMRPEFARVLPQPQVNGNGNGAVKEAVRPAQKPTVQPKVQAVSGDSMSPDERADAIVELARNNGGRVSVSEVVEMLGYAGNSTPASKKSAARRDVARAGLVDVAGEAGVYALAESVSKQIA